MNKRFVRFLRRNTIALLALFVALSGTTYAAANAVLPKNSVGSKQLRKNAVTTPKIKNGAVTGAKIKLSSLGKVPSATTADSATHATSADSATNSAQLGGVAAASYLQRSTVLWAVVDATGIVRGSGAVSSTNPGTGLYTVVFNRNVSQCAYIATSGSTSGTNPPGSYPSQAEASVSALSGNANGVVVTRADGSGALHSFPFFVAVFC